MSKIYIRRGFLIAAVLFFLQTLPAVANQPPTEKQPTDTTTTREPPVPPDSAHEKTRREVSEVLEWLREAEADTADTTKPPRVQVVPPTTAGAGCTPDSDIFSRNQRGTHFFS